MSELMIELRQWEWIGILLARLAVGMLFAISGAGKLFVPEKKEQMRKTLKEAGVPAPDVNVVFVSAVEFVFGGFLVVGLLTPLACMMLACVMVVAIVTVKLATIEADSLTGWLGEFLFLPDVLYLVMLIWLLFSGPGWLSLDHLLAAG